MKRFNFFVLSVATALFAQAYDFKVRVVEARDSLDLDNARVKVFEQDSICKGDVLTDGYGIASFTNLDAGDYLLTIEKDGFRPLRALFYLNDNVDVGDVALHSNNESVQALNEVVVTGARVTQSHDKMTIRPLKSTVESSINSLDLLRKLNLPGLQVNPIARTISIFNSVPILKVDGIERSISYLASINPNQISRIEYTDNPSTRYLQDGAGGVINVILKAQHQGGSIYLSAASSPYQAVMDGMLLATYNYKLSQFQINVSDSWRNYAKDQKYTSHEEYIGNADGFRETRDLTSDRHFNYNTLDIAASYQYQTPSGFMLNTSFTISPQNNFSRITGDLLIDDDKSVNSYTWSKSKSLDPSLDVYLKKEWNDGKSIEANLAGSISDSKIHRFNEENFTDNPFSIYTYTHGKSKGLIGEVRWKQPIGKVDWTIGVKESYSHSRNNYTNNRKESMDFSRTYLDTEFGGDAGNLSWSAGGGLGYSDTKSEALHLREWTPGALVSLFYSFPHRISLSFWGQYAPIFPSLSERSAIVEIKNPLLSTTGNTNLRTSHKWDLSLRPAISGNNYSVWLQLYNSHINRPKVSETIYEGNGKFMSIPVNFNHYNGFKTTLGAGYYNLFKHLDISGQVCYEDQRYSAHNFRNNTRFFYGQVEATAYWGGFYLSANYRTRTKEVNGYNVMTTPQCLTLAAAYIIPHFQFSVLVTSIGYKSTTVHYRNHTDSPHYVMNSKNYFEAFNNFVQLRVTYNLQIGRSYQSRGKGLNNKVTDNSILRVID